MLRHRVDLGELSGVDRSVEKRTVVARYRAAHKVEFRRGGDMGEVEDALAAHKAIELRAAVGAGKSTEVPMLISKKKGALVIHTIPFGIAARYLAEYLINIKKGGDVSYVDDIESDLPAHGVVLMSNATFASRYMSRRFDYVKGAVLYLDETHESDCWTAVIRKVSPGLDCFVNVIQATATAGPEDRMPAHLPGRRVEGTYAAAKPETWSALDQKKPWSISEIDGNTMICLDNRSVRKRLAQEYEEAGFTVHLLDSHSSYDKFLSAVRALKARDQVVNIVIVDYAYRSSFTIPGLDCIIDSCEVAVPQVDAHGVPVIRHRPAYDFEVQQFLGRGGRVAGESVKLYRSAERSPSYMCDLEQVEADAANLLYRMMGFRPPTELANHAFYDGDVPVDLAAAFMSDQPLKCCPPESREPWVNGDPAPGVARVDGSSFVYNLPKRGKSKHMTCATDYEDFRPVSPPPAVPRQHTVTRVASREFDEYADSRSSSPTPTVYTLDSAEPDTLSMFENRDKWSGGKPKRIAKRVLEEQAAQEAKERAGLEVPSVKSNLPKSAVQDFGVSSSILDVPDMPVSMPCIAPEVPPKDGVPFVGSADEVRALHEMLMTQGPAGTVACSIDDEVGSYIYYSGMERAPQFSDYFLKGYVSVVEFASDRNARLHVRGLPERDRLFAVKALVDCHNQSTATVMGVGRVLRAISQRRAAEFAGALDRQQLMSGFERMMAEAADAKLMVRTCKSLIPLFAKYSLVELERAHQLEQSVMQRMMQGLEDVVVKNDPERMDDYMSSLNARVPAMIQSGGGMRSQRYLE